MKLGKQLTCKQCGCTDFSQQDDMFVCLACGTKYSVAEAKTILTDGGTMNIQGTTINIDSLNPDDSTFKCKSCGGTLVKEGNVYICQKCGKALKNNDNVIDMDNINSIDNSPNHQLFDIVLTKLPAKLGAIKVIRELTGWDLKEAKECVDNASMNMPYTYKSSLPKTEALRIAKMFSDSGNSAEVSPTIYLE